MRRKLNIRQARFAEFLAQGHTQLEAYREAGYSVCSTKGGEANAAKAAKHPGVQDRVREIQKRVEEATLLTIREKRQYYATLVRGEIKASVSDRLRASEMDSKLAGHDLPQEMNYRFKVVIGEEDRGGERNLLEAETVEPSLPSPKIRPKIVVSEEDHFQSNNGAQVESSPVARRPHPYPKPRRAKSGFLTH